MTGAELSKEFAERLRAFLASEACGFALTWVGKVEEYKTPPPQFTVSDGSYGYTISIEFEDPR